MAAALRRTNNEVKVEMEVEDENAGNPSDDTDIEYNEEEEIELEDDDNDKYLNQPLVPNETFNSKYNFVPGLILVWITDLAKSFHGQFSFQGRFEMHDWLLLRTGLWYIISFQSSNNKESKSMATKCLLI